MEGEKRGSLLAPGGIGPAEFAPRMVPDILSSRHIGQARHSRAWVVDLDEKRLQMCKSPRPLIVTAQ